MRLILYLRAGVPRDGATVTGLPDHTDFYMDIGVTGFGPESAIDRSLAMVSVVTK